MPCATLLALRENLTPGLLCCGALSIRERRTGGLLAPERIGPVAQWLEPTAHNGLVGGSNPPGPTTQSYATGDFLKEYEKPRIGGIRATVRSQRRHRYSRQVVSAHFSLAPKSRFPETETARGRDSVRMPVTPKEVRACGAAETIRWRSEPRI